MQFRLLHRKLHFPAASASTNWKFRTNPWCWELRKMQDMYTWTVDDLLQEQVGLLSAEVVRIQEQVETAVLSCGSEETVTDCLQQVASICGDLQQRVHVFLVDFDLQFFLASSSKETAAGRRLTTCNEHTDTVWCRMGERGWYCITITKSKQPLQLISANFE